MGETPSYTLAELANLTGAKLLGDSNHRIDGVEDLEAAGPSQAAFLENPRYERQLNASQAGVVFIQEAPENRSGNYLVTKTPSLAFQKAIELFVPKISSGFSGIHPTAVIHESAHIAENVSIGPYCVIDRAVSIGSGTTLSSSVTIGAETAIGEHCQICSGVKVEPGSQIGSRVIIQSGAVIGSSGFGYFSDQSGTHHPLEQRGNVILEDDVEVGANTTIDRARFKSTRIRKGTKIDNLVQIAHQVEVGPHNLIVSQVGIAGSTKTGSHVVMGGQVGCAGHVEICAGAIFAARSAISKSITKPGVYLGVPAEPKEKFNENFVQGRRLIKRMKKFESVIKRFEELENLQEQ